MGLAVVAWKSRRDVSARKIALAAVVGGAILASLVAAGLATGKLDRQVLTQSTLSMRYRWEYWQATWSVITGGARDTPDAIKAAVLRRGVGPGNFRPAYLFYKLPQASEEILDPHNLFLEVWATAGFWAFLALLTALAVGLWNVLGPARAPEDGPGATGSRLPGAAKPAAASPKPDDGDGDGPPRSTLWLMASAGAGWGLVIALGMMNLFESDMFVRWLLLGAGWLIAAMMLLPLWRLRPIPAAALGAAVLAVVVNLLAAGGIGIPTVALGLWSLLALGLNLREDRACGRLREAHDRAPPLVLSTVWAASVGVFFGDNLSYWRSEAWLAVAEDAVRPLTPDFDRAEIAYNRAIEADRFYVRPWILYARFAEYAWLFRGQRPSDMRWKKVPELLEQAVKLPRNPNSWALHRQRAEAIRELMTRLGSELSPEESVRLGGEIVKEWRTASRLYPNNAMLHARLAEASVGISMFADAVKEAQEALRLDDLMPHADRKLSQAERRRLEALIADSRSRESPKS